MAITHIQTNTASDLDGSMAIVLNGVAVGNLLVVNTDFYTKGGTHAVSDSGGNSWTKVIGPVVDYDSATDASQWWAIVASGKGGNLTFTISASGKTYCTAFVSEFNAGSGKQWKATPFDRGASNPEYGGSARTSGVTLTRSQGEELLVGGYFDGASATTTIVAGTNIAWTIPTNGSQSDGVSNTRGATEYFVASSAGTDAATFTGGEVSSITMIGTYMNEASDAGEEIIPYAGLLFLTGLQPTAENPGATRALFALGSLVTPDTGTVTLRVRAKYV